MALWVGFARKNSTGNCGFGLLVGDHIEVHQGDLFGGS